MFKLKRCIWHENRYLESNIVLNGDKIHAIKTRNILWKAQNHIRPMQIKTVLTNASLSCGIKQLWFIVIVSQLNQHLIMW